MKGTPSTYLLTDVVDSTGLLTRYPDDAPDAMKRHDAIVAAVVGRHSGRHPKERGEGDSHLAIFATATDAIQAACSLQLAIQSEPWPQGLPLIVRVAVHTGYSEVLSTGDVLGLDVNLCGHVRDTAWGGQTLVTEPSFHQVSSALPSPLHLEPLGQHVIAGLAEPIGIYQLYHPDLPASFPPIKSRQPVPNNLPVDATPFTGRVIELGAVVALLESSRLLTLKGVGGCGKTRLALQTARQSLGRHPDGVWFVELASISNPDNVARTVAARLNLRLAGIVDDVDAVAEALANQTALLILDNCEHVVDAAAMLAEALLRRCRSLRIMATSTSLLELPNEVSFEVPSMSLPESSTEVDPALLERYDATRLFLKRARLRNRQLRPTTGEATAIIELCQRVDGLPLAIELAAAQTDVMAPSDILRRFDFELNLLPDRNRSSVRRHQTMSAAIEWSFRLLAEPYQRLFAQLSVFAGGFALPAVEAVATSTDDPARFVRTALAALVRSSMVQEQEIAGEPRLRLLETLRTFGRLWLEDKRELEATSRRHAHWFAAWVLQVEPQLNNSERTEAMDRVAVDIDNIRAALGWLLRDGDVTLGLQLASAMWGYWQTRGHFSEGRVQIEAFLKAADDSVDPDLVAHATRRAGALAHYQGDLEQARRHYLQALAYSRQHDTPQTTATLLSNLALIDTARGDSESAIRQLEESLAIATKEGDVNSMAAALNNLGLSLLQTGDLQAAERHSADSVALLRQQHNQASLASGLSLLGTVLLAEGRPADAYETLEESLRLRVERMDKPGMAESRILLAETAGTLGNWDEARALLTEALAITADAPSPWHRTDALVVMALLDLEVGRMTEAVESLEVALDLATQQERRDMRASALHGLGRVASVGGDRVAARAYLEAALDIRRQAGLRQGVADSLSALARLSCIDGDPSSAIPQASEALAHRLKMGDRAGIAASLEDFVVVAALRHDYADALRLDTGAATERRRLGIPRTPTEWAFLQPSLESAQRTIGASEAAAIRTAGAKESLGELLARLNALGPVELLPA